MFVNFSFSPLPKNSHSLQTEFTVCSLVGVRQYSGVCAQIRSFEAFCFLSVFLICCCCTLHRSDQLSEAALWSRKYKHTVTDQRKDFSGDVNMHLNSLDTIVLGPLDIAMQCSTDIHVTFSAIIVSKFIPSFGL